MKISLSDKIYTPTQLNSLSSSTLAYIGDAYFTLAARLSVLGRSSAKPNKLHKDCTQLVNAGAQGELLEKVREMLTDEEAAVVKRARNAPTNTKSKHFGIADYKRATSFEALIGYLYLAGRYERLNELMAIILGEE